MSTVILDIIFHQDPSHGWIEVDRKMLRKLKIENKISSCSYQRGNKVYLEEDVDAGLALRAMKASGIEYEIHEEHLEVTPIRNYQPFSL